MSVQFHDPKAAPLAVAEPYRLSAKLDDPITIGMLANGFPDSEEFLEAVEASLAEVLPNAAFRRYNKGNASILVSDEMLNDIKSECQAVVAAYGH